MRKIILLLLVLLAGFKFAAASHLFGGEIFYTHISGNTYKIRLILYGDCSVNNQPNFQALPNVSPEVEIYNNFSYVNTINLNLEAGSGVDIAPLCPGQISNCNGGTAQGVKKFSYSANVTLPTTSTNWRFLFTGQLPGTTNYQAGRSNALTNVNVPNPGGSVMQLEATLNNSSVTFNNSPTYTSIPTPFFCINSAQNFNQGAVDPDGDALSFALTDGLEASNNTTVLVTYISPYTAQNPLAVQTGTFNFNTSNGQLSFTPNALQNSLVVTKVTETRNNVVVGTSMREMVFVGINCNNTPPGGIIGTSSIGTVIDSSYNVLACGNINTVNFTVNPTDANNNNISVSYAGLPNNASITVTNNNTPSPIINFNWPIPPNTPQGNYTFFITYQDDACPLSSLQTLAYTIKLKPTPSVSGTTTPVNCVAGPTGSINISGAAGLTPYTYSINGSVYQSTGAFNSVNSGIYTIYVKDANNCTATSTVNVIFNQAPVINAVNLTNASCSPGCDGSATINATSSFTPATLTYSNNNINYQNTNAFSSLCAGAYTIYVKDANNCTKSSVITITTPPGPNIVNVTTTNASCSPGCDGSINTITATSNVGGIQYSINNINYQSSQQFTQLCKGNYTIYVKDANGCTSSSALTITTPPPPTISSLATVTASCVPGCDGAINNIVASSVNGAVQYSIGGPFQVINSFASLCAGNYTLTVKDAIGCTVVSAINIATQTPPSISNVTLTTASCFPGCDGSVSVNASSTLTLSYQLNNNAAQSSNTITSLCVGNYTVVVSDTKGCTASTAISIIQAPPPTVVNTISQNVSCSGKNDGIIDVDATSNNGAITYVLLPNNTTNALGEFNNLAPGTYTVAVSDPKGCTISEVFTIVEPSPLSVSQIITKDIQCQNYDDGIIQITASGGNNAYFFTLLPGNESNSNGLFPGLAPGSYTIEVKDIKGCFIDTFVTLNALYVPMTVSVTANDIPCSGTSSDGSASITVQGGSPPFTYIWQTTPQQFGPQATGLFGGTYKFAIKDVFGCVWNDSVVLRDPSYCCNLVFVPNAFSPNDDNKNDRLGIKTQTNLQVLEFMVNDRWGNYIWSGNNIDQFWDGRFKEKECELGTYFYYLRYRCLTNDQIYIKKGDVTLLR